MKRRAPMKRTELARGKPLERKTPMPRGRSFKQRGSVGDASLDGPTPPPRNGPVKARSESTHIPDPIRKAVLERDGHCCSFCGIAIDRLHYSLHHRRPRGMGGSKRLHTMANLVTLCGSGVDGCHGVVERDRSTGRRTGWLVPHGVTPEEWPVLRRTSSGVGWWQPGETWTPAEPHPRQIEEAA